MSEHRPANLNELIKLAKGTKFESAAGDEKKLEELLLKEMRASGDPMTWHTVATNSAYAEYIDRNVEAMRRFDFDATADALAAERAAAEREAEQARERQDDDEPFSRGVLKRRRGREPR